MVKIPICTLLFFKLLVLKFVPYCSERKFSKIYCRIIIATILTYLMLVHLGRSWLPHLTSFKSLGF